MASGCVLRGFTIAEVKDMFASRFNVTEELAQRCLNKKPTVMKKALTKADALQYREVLVGLGMDAAIEPMAGSLTPQVKRRELPDIKIAAKNNPINAVGCAALAPSLNIVRNASDTKQRVINWKAVHSVFFSAVLLCSLLGVIKRAVDVFSGS